MMLNANTKLENIRTEKGAKHFPFFTLDLKFRLKSSGSKKGGSKKGAKRVSFLDLPGEIRNQCYDEVLRCSSESPGAFLRMSKADGKDAKVKHSTAWTLTQVSKQIRAELLPLVQAARIPRVALCDFAEYLQVFHINPTITKFSSVTKTGQCDQDNGDNILIPQQGTIIAWASRSNVYGPLPSKGVNLLPILYALDKCPDVSPNFSSHRMLNEELAVLDALHRTWKLWRHTITFFDILEMNLETATYFNNPDDPSEYYEGRTGSILTIHCKKSVHGVLIGEDELVDGMWDWIRGNQLRKIAGRKHYLKIFFVTAMSPAGQPGAVELSIFPDWVDFYWFDGWTAVDDEDALTVYRYKAHRGWRQTLSCFGRV